jgi:ribosomal-protein-alanine N-acetyltransferase
VAEADGIRPALLRSWSPADSGWYVAQLSDSEIQRFTSERADATIEDFRLALDELSQREDLAGFAIIDPATGELAGNLAASLEDGTAYIHYWIARSHRRRGLATAALNQMCQWIAANWAPCVLALNIYADNRPSQRLAEKAGFQHDPERDHLDELTLRSWRLYTRPCAR